MICLRILLEREGEAPAEPLHRWLGGSLALPYMLSHSLICSCPPLYALALPLLALVLLLLGVGSPASTDCFPFVAT